MQKRNRSFMKFCVVGGCSTLLDMVIYFALFNMLGSIWSKIISMSCSMIFSYNFNKRWSFAVKTQKTGKELISFFVTQIVNLTVNVGTNYVVLTISQMKLVAFVVATAFAMTVNYSLQRFWVFGGTE